MATTIQISSVNFNGQTANVTFSPATGGTINLGPQVIPFDYTNDYYYGTYDIVLPSQTCQLVISAPAPSPTPSVTPSVTPTNTPTVTPTSSETPTPTPTITSTPTITPTNTTTPTITPTNTPTPTTSPVTSWTPADFTNLWDWWSSDYGVNYSIGFNSINSWSGHNGAVLVPLNTSYYPNYISADSSFNNQPSVEINPLAQNVDGGFYVPMSPNNTSKTAFVIGKLITKTLAGDNALLAWGPGANPRAGIWGSTSTSTYWNYSSVSGDESIYAGTTFINGEYQLLRLSYDRITGDLSYYETNVLSSFQTTTTVRNISSGLNFTLGNFTVGCYMGAYGPSPRISVVEVIFIDGIPTSGELTNLETYLNTKYGITL